MRLIMLGPPGAGKGTLARVLADEMGIPHISTGDIFRDAMKNETELGKTAKTYIDKGELVPDEVTVGMVRERVSMDDCGDGFILDGFPRTVPQAESLEGILKDLGISLDAVIDMQASKEVIVNRLVMRRTCPACGEIYNLTSTPPEVENICDKCQSELVQRKDDTREVIENRIDVYNEKTGPLTDFYGKKGILLAVDGNQQTAQVLEEIRSRLEKSHVS
jgi:adenylate kinase